MQPFEYANPSTLQEALGLLGSRWGEADVLAGGTDLLGLLKDDIHTPKRVVNIKSIAELGGIASTPAGLRIGATVTLDELIDHAVIRKSYPSLSTAALGVASQQIRSIGTVGGDLCQRPRCWYFRAGHGLLGKELVPNGENKYHAILGGGPAYFVSASSLGPALVALNARVKLASSKGSREVPVQKFFVTPKTDTAREIALLPNEILTEVIIPAGGGRNATYEIRQREALDWPLATASVSLRMKGSTVAAARIVLGHVAPVPWFSPEAAQAIAGKTINEETAMEAGKAAVAQASPLSQNAYKVQLGRVAVKRALLAAAGRA
jgi:xanthine dehydrogenase YagS FAD-binding subunit